MDYVRIVLDLTQTPIETHKHMEFTLSMAFKSNVPLFYATNTTHPYKHIQIKLVITVILLFTHHKQAIKTILMHKCFV